MKNRLKRFSRVMLILAAIMMCAVCSMEGEKVKAASRPKVRVTKRTKKTATIKISKSKATGYQVYLSTSKRGGYKLLMATRTQYYKITGLKQNKTYYVKVRGYRTRGYHISRGKYSKAIKIQKYKKKVTKKKTTTTKTVEKNEITAMTTEALKSINAERTNRGLATLQSDTALCTAADARAKELAQNYSHTRPDGREFQTVLEDASYQCNYATEDIYMGTPNLSEVLTTAMTSADRAENMFSSSLTKMAIGHYYDEATTQHYWVFLFVE